MLLLAVAILQAQSVPPHLQMARDLVSNLKLASLNVYGGGPRQIDWSTDHPSARTVCSSFQTLLLMHSYNLSEADIKAWFGKKNPKAEDYYDAIVKGEHFTRITKYSDIKPGDFIAIKYTDGHISKDGNEDSGHVMLIEAAPVGLHFPLKLPEKTLPLPNGNHEVGVISIVELACTFGIIDSTSSGHGTKDSRFKDGKYSGGIGRGKIQLIADQNGNLEGYAWSDAKNSKRYKGPDRLIAVGRLKL